MHIPRFTSAALSFVLMTSPLVRAQTPGPAPGPAPAPAETYTATLQVKGQATASTTIRIELQRYTPDRDREPVENGLKYGGYPAFLAALRKARKVGTVTGADRTWTIRWASARPVPGGRKIVLITDQPMYFLGGGRADAKPRAGYEIGVIQMEVDEAGNGTGSVAAAAKVKPGEDGVVVDDYGDERIEIAKVERGKP
jgi:hypothetical protein